MILFALQVRSTYSVAIGAYHVYFEHAKDGIEWSNEGDAVDMMLCLWCCAWDLLSQGGG